jgi:hypothetical protein
MGVSTTTDATANRHHNRAQMDADRRAHGGSPVGSRRCDSRGPFARHGSGNRAQSAIPSRCPPRAPGSSAHAWARQCPLPRGHGPDARIRRRSAASDVARRADLASRITAHHARVRCGWHATRRRGDAARGHYLLRRHVLFSRRRRGCRSRGEHAGIGRHDCARVSYGLGRERR